MKLVYLFTLCLILIGCKQELKNEKIKNIQSFDSLVDLQINVQMDTVDLDFIEAKEIQYFEIDTKKDNVLEGLQGTKIYLDTKCFNDTLEKVTVELIECYRVKDIILNKLSTITKDSNILETDGMLKLTILNDCNVPIELLKEIRIDIPCLERDNSMNLYEGEGIDNVVWEKSTRKIRKPKPIFTNIPIGEEVIKTKKSVVNNYYNTVYSFSSKRQGWYNIDKLHDGGQRVIVNVVKEKNLLYYVVYKDYNIIHSISNSEITLFDDAEAFIIGIGNEGDNSFRFGVELFKVRKNQTLKIDSYSLMTMAEIENELDRKLQNSLIERVI